MSLREKEGKRLTELMKGETEEKKRKEKKGGERKQALSIVDD